MRGTAPAPLSREMYVSQRSEALSHLKTQHNLSNVSIVMSGAQVEVGCNFQILRLRLRRLTRQVFHSHGQYRFGVVRTEESWSISSINQFVLTNDGNPALHEGIKR